MKKAIQQTAILISLVSLLVLPYFVFAASSTSITDRLQNAGSGASGPYAAADSTTLASIVGMVINVALSLLGIIFVILIVLAGFKWMMAGGNEDDVTKAKSSMQTAVIGLVITLSAYAIWTFISNYLL